jgi:hypothetical protein
MKLNQVLHEESEITFDMSTISHDRPSVVFNPTNNQPAISTQQSADNPPDKITLDVPLFIRLLEWAKEDAGSDMQLHKIAEKIITMSRIEQTLSMQNYDEIISCCKKTRKLNDKS